MDMKDYRMDNLRQIREKENMTQLHLSMEISVSQELISQYEIRKV